MNKVKTEMVAVQKAKELSLTDADETRMKKMGEKIKAQFKSRAGVTYYRFFYTEEEFLGFIKMCYRFHSELVAYNKYKEV